MRATFKAPALIAGTAMLAGACLVTALSRLGSVPLETLALFAGAALVTELFVIHRDENSEDPRDQTSFTFSASIHIATLLVLGIWAAVVVAAFGALAADAVDRVPARKLLFNASAAVIAVAVGGLVFGALGGRPGSLDLPGDFPAIAFTALVVYGVGAVLVTSIISLSLRMPIRSLVHEGLLGGLAAAIGEAGVGVALAVFALTEPWAAIALLPLVLAVYRSHERLVTLRRETAHSLETFANVVDERDPYTYQHSARVAEYVRSLAEALALPPRTVSELRWAGRLHDLGKISVDAAVLRKPAKLDADEWAAIRLHPRLSARLLRRFRLASKHAKAVEYHHERFDGNGYYGVAPSELPLGAHFLIVADSFDAMTSDRPYRSAMPVEVALAEIESQAGSQFHPAVAKAFVAHRRDLDPISVLSAEERAAIDELSVGHRRHLLARPFAIRPRTVAAAMAVVGLLVVAAGSPTLAVPALVAAAVATALERTFSYRAKRLSARLQELSRSSCGRDELFATLVAEIAKSCHVRWAGLIAWAPSECRGWIELEWGGGGDRQNEAVLTSWLLREAESGSAPIVSIGADLGSEDAHIAVPLRSDGSESGYLVLAVAGRISELVESALGAAADSIAVPLLSPQFDPPRRGELRAVAS